MHMNFDSALDKLRRAGYTVTRRNARSKQWYSRCPAHDDERASLSLTEKDGKLLIHCFAGCEFQAVVDAINNLKPVPLIKREPVLARQGMGIQDMGIRRDPEIKGDPVPITIRREPVRRDD